MNRATRRDRARFTLRKMNLSVGARDTITLMQDAYGSVSNPAFWPAQKTIARDLGKGVRTIRRHLAEAERAGVLLVTRFRAMRDAATGRWRRRRTNRYFVRPAKGQVAPSGHRRPLYPYSVRGTAPAAPMWGPAAHDGCAACDGCGWVERPDGWVRCLALEPVDNVG